MGRRPVYLAEMKGRCLTFSIEEIANHLHPGHGERGGAAAAREGMRIHRLLAGRMGYRPEVPVRSERRIGGDRIVVTGRMDGVEESLLGDRLYEVKTYIHAPSGLEEAAERFPHHLLQLRLYALLWAKEHEVAECIVLAVPRRLDGRLDASRCRRILVPPLDVEKELMRGLRSLRWFRRVEAARRRQRPGIRLPDPFDCWRDPQLAMIEFLRSRGRALLVAATGSGKTGPLLLAALDKSFCKGRSVFFATAKTSGQPPVVKTAAEMRGKGSTLRVLRLAAADRLCPGEDCRYVAGHRRQAIAAVRQALKRGIVEREDLLELERRFQVCARELQRDLVPLVDLLLGDMNFVLDPRPSARDLSPLVGGIVLDEAHNVYERVREALSAELRLDDVKRAWRGRGSEAFLARKVLSALSKLPDSGEPGNYGILLPLARSAGAMIAGGADSPFLRGLSSLEFPIKDSENSREVFCDKEAVRFVALDPAPFIAGRLGSRESLFLASATMHPPEDRLSLIGLSDLPVLDLDDPFAKQRRILLVPCAGSRFRERVSEAPRAAEAISRLVAASPGRYLAFASSYDHAALIVKGLQSLPLEVVSQERGLDRAAIKEMAESYCRGSGPAVLVAPAGGLLAEGIDLPPGLSGVFLLGPALPAFTKERRALRRYQDRLGSDGFRLVFLIPGLTKVVQAAGRVVRGEGQEAWIFLLDRRLATPAYRRLLPRSYQEAPVVGLDDAVRLVASSRSLRLDPRRKGPPGAFGQLLAPLA